jgi:hypothetical protein
VLAVDESASVIAAPYGSSSDGHAGTAAVVVAVAAAAVSMVAEMGPPGTAAFCLTLLATEHALVINRR